MYYIYVCIIYIYYMYVYGIYRYKYIYMYLVTLWMEEILQQLVDALSRYTPTIYRRDFRLEACAAQIWVCPMYPLV